jgi:radical SAM protein with 4Fe4S-binding SPASM domain
VPADMLQLSEITELGKRETIPSSVLVEVCYTCNEDCRHCCIDDHSKRGLTLEQYGALFDQMVRAGTFYVILSGGEPFTRRDFMQIVRAARKRRLSVTVFTNGTLVTDQHVADLRALYVDEVHVSLYAASAALHDGITKMSGSFAKSRAAIDKLLAAGVTVRIKCPLMRMTAGGVGELKELAKQLGVTIQYSPIVTARNDGDLQTHQFRLVPAQLRKVVGDADIIPRGVGPIYFRENPDCIPCDVVFNGGSIDPDGNVYACNQLRIVGGNILSRPLGEIWKESRAFKDLRAIRLRDLEECSRCELFQHCTRCPGLAYLEDGNLLGCSSVAKVVAEERSRVGVYPAETHIFSRPLARKEEKDEVREAPDRSSGRE